MSNTTIKVDMYPHEDVARLRAELTAARDDAEKLRGRVAELEAGYTKLCNSASLTRKILQDSARRDGITDVKAHANWGHLDTAEHEDTITRSDARPWVLRKQAEAVERAKHEHALTARIPDGTAGEHFQDGFDTAAEQYDASIDRYAQRLRSQANELEKAGGSNEPKE